VFDAAASDAIKAKLKEHVTQARERGLFGSPSFLTADGELFWGNDRLESALEWAVHHRSMETA
jgi:2-hydroxychromene-2-carboxylate isomerase